MMKINMTYSSKHISISSSDFSKSLAKSYANKFIQQLGDNISV